MRANAPPKKEAKATAKAKAGPQLERPSGGVSPGPGGVSPEHGPGGGSLGPLPAPSSSSAGHRLLLTAISCMERVSQQQAVIYQQQVQAAQMLQQQLPQQLPQQQQLQQVQQQRQQLQQQQQQQRDPGTVSPWTSWQTMLQQQQQQMMIQQQRHPLQHQQQQQQMLPEIEVGWSHGEWVCIAVLEGGPPM